MRNIYTIFDGIWSGFDDSEVEEWGEKIQQKLRSWLDGRMGGLECAAVGTSLQISQATCCEAIKYCVYVVTLEKHPQHTDR